MLAVAVEDFDIYIVDIDTRRIVRKFVGHTAQITDATFSPDSRWLISSSMDCSIRTWDIPSCQLVDQFSTEVACVSLNMSPTGEVLSTAHVDYLGIFLWTNRTLYSKVSLKALTPCDEPELMSFPECLSERKDEELEIEDSSEEPDFVSPEQLSNDLVTLSGLPSSRWQNLLNLDLIKMRNKPKLPPKAPKAAPFFLPTVSALNFQFNLGQSEPESGSKLLIPASLLNLTEFGKMLDKTRQNEDFKEVIEKLKSFSPSVIDFEIKSLAPEGGGSAQVMLQFLKVVEFMLKSNKDFELAEAYLSVFLKSHGTIVATEESLRNYLTNIQSCHNVVWHRLQEQLLYNMCVVQNLKLM
jgi:U3 small nucleolar RNA-associated protein 21